MNEYLFLKFAHILALVYWLGGDLGTFLASHQVINRDNSTESRHVALKIMLACDMGPKLAMPLILPLGVHLAAALNLIVLPPLSLAVLWAVCLYWFASVLFLFLREGEPVTQVITRIDFYLRIAIVVAISGFALAGLWGLAPIQAEWVAWKLLVFAALVACGIAIRINLKPFVPAFGDMMANGATEDNNSAMEHAIARCRPFVWAIWAGLFLNTALGIRLLS